MPTAHITTLSGLGGLPRILESVGGANLLERVFAAADVPLVAMDDLTRKIPTKKFLDIFEQAERHLPDPRLGVQLGQNTRPAEFGLWARYVIGAPDLAGMLRRAQRTVYLHQTCAALKAIVHDGRLKWTYVLPELPPNRLHIDHVLVPMLSAVRQYAGLSWNPQRIEVRYCDGPWRKHLEDFYQAPIVFNQPVNALVMPAELIGERRRNGGHGVSDLSFADLRRMVANRPTATYSATVLSAVKLKLLEGRHDIESVASSISKSVRSLQRELNRESTSFRFLIDQARLENAKHFLVNFDIPLTQLAQELGYSDQAHFTRAFQRWCGCSPSSYRKLLRARQLPPESLADDRFS